MLLGVVVVLLGSASQAAIPERVEPEAIPNYRRVRPEIATAGQPTQETLARLAQLGFRTVVNLRTAGEDALVGEERALVEAAGLRYVHVPITPQSFSLDDVSRVRAVLEDATAAPVLLHCSSANRVGALWMVIERQKGRPLDEVLREAETIGLKSTAMREAAGRLLDLGTKR